MTEQDLPRPEGSQPAVAPSPPKRRFWSPEKIGALVGAILVGSVGGTKFILNISADPVITVAMVLIYALIGAFVGGLVGKSMRGSSGKAKQDPPQPKTAQPAVSAPPPKPRSWTAETAGAIAGAVLVGGFMGVGLHLGGFALLLLALLGAFFGGAAGKLIMYLVGPR